MGQYNLGVLNNMSVASKVVSMGDPETLILNHSTKNTVYIGNTPSVGSGNLLDATPLDPYASIVVDGKQDVYAIAAVPSLPASIYTFQNAISWTPKAVQPNIVDPASPMVVPPGTTVQNFTVPPGAQGVAIYAKNLAGSVPNWTNLTVEGVQTQNFYINKNPSTDNNYYYYVPVLSDDDTSVSIAITSTSPGTLSFNITWIMSSLVSTVVASGASQGVTVLNASLPVTQSGTWNVNATEQSKQMFANQSPAAFDSTLAAGGTLTLVAAAGGVTNYLHDFRIEYGNSPQIYPQLQDSTGVALANLLTGIIGTPTNVMIPPMGVSNFHGAPVTIGRGIVLKNMSANTERFTGYLTYSQ